MVCSYVGYRAQEVALDGNDEIQVEMSQDVQMLDDLVVIGYGTQRKIEITSAVARVTEEDFNQGGSRYPLLLIKVMGAGMSIIRPGGRITNAGTETNRWAATL